MKTGKNMSKRIVKLLIAVSACLLLTGCVNTGAHIVPSVTIPRVYAAPRAYPKPYAGAGAGGGNGGSQQRIR